MRSLSAAATPSANGKDPLAESGLTALEVGCDLADVAMALRRWRPLLPSDPLARRVERDRAIEQLKAIGTADASGLVDAAVPPAAPASGDMQGQAVAFGDPEPWGEPVDGAELLERMHRLITRYLDLPTGGAVLLSAFALYTYCPEAFAAAPYIVFHSPAPQCGKTRSLEVLVLLLRRPWLTVVPSTAVLFRVLEAHAPTLLLDEAEVVHGRGDSAKDVKALLQAGYRRGAFVPRCVGDGNEVRNFRVFGPKVFALIGELPTALFDRCIPVEMQRRPRVQGLARFRPPRVENEALELRRMARRWAEDHREALGAVEVPTLDFLDERSEEVWEPLVAVGIVAGGDWLGRLLDAARQLSGGRHTTSPGVELLADIRTVFVARNVERIRSEDLAAALAKMEGRRWPEWSRGRPITMTALARLLKPFGVAPMPDGETRGYKRDALAPVWEQYLNLSTRQEPSNRASESSTLTRQADSGADGLEMPENLHGDLFSDTLTGQRRGEGLVRPDVGSRTCPKGHAMHHYGNDPAAGWVCPACHPAADAAMRGRV